MSDDMAAVIRKCLQADPTHRYEGMGNASIDVRSAAEAILPALTAAGYAVVKPPHALVKLERLRAIVDEQAEDEGLWFVAQTAPEAYLQQELRRLHAAIEATP